MMNKCTINKLYSTNVILRTKCTVNLKLLATISISVLNQWQLALPYPVTVQLVRDVFCGLVSQHSDRIPS